jgi:hypothetical protein
MAGILNDAIPSFDSGARLRSNDGRIGSLSGVQPLRLCQVGILAGMHGGEPRPADDRVAGRGGQLCFLEELPAEVQLVDRREVRLANGERPAWQSVSVRLLPQKGRIRGLHDNDETWVYMATWPYVSGDALDCAPLRRGLNRSVADRDRWFEGQLDRTFGSCFAAEHGPELKAALLASIDRVASPVDRYHTNDHVRVAVLGDPRRPFVDPLLSQSRPRQGIRLQQVFGCGPHPRLGYEAIRDGDREACEALLQATRDGGLFSEVVFSDWNRLFRVPTVAPELTEFAQRVLRGSIYLALAGPPEGLAPRAGEGFPGGQARATERGAAYQPELDAVERENAALRSFLYRPGQPVMHLVREIYFGVMVQINTSLTRKPPEPVRPAVAIAEPSLSRERFAALAGELVWGDLDTQLLALELLAPLARARSDEGQRLRGWLDDFESGLDPDLPANQRLFAKLAEISKLSD